MSSSFMPADIASLVQAGEAVTAKKSTSRKGNTELNMEDFLKLMVAQLQYQTMDDTMDTSEMLGQMVQMQMVTALANMTDASVMGYASSLVGKTVTIGIPSDKGLEEREVEVIGTALSNGQQVIFGKDAKGNTETYALSQIMAVGRMPEKTDANKVEDPTQSGEAGEENPENAPVNNAGEAENAQGGGAQQPEYKGEQGADAAADD